MQIFPCSRQTNINIKMRVSLGNSTLRLFFWQEILCMLGCNFATLAILDVCVCNMSATKPTREKPSLCEIIMCDLAWYRLVLTALHGTPIILQVHQHVSSLDYLIHEFSQRSPLFYTIVAYLRIFLSFFFFITS